MPSLIHIRQIFDRRIAATKRSQLIDEPKVKEFARGKNSGLWVEWFRGFQEIRNILCVNPLQVRCQPSAPRLTTTLNLVSLASVKPPAILLGCLLFACAGFPASAREGWTQARFRETDALLCNPGQGWMAFCRSTPRFPCSVMYFRFGWDELEPAKGQYHWKPIEDSIALARRNGAMIALRIMTTNAHSKGYYCSPQWIFDLGCKGFEYEITGTDTAKGSPHTKRIEPDYADPVYLTEHDAFIAALGKEFDGSPDVEFLDIGSYGIWGEWHTTHPAPVEVRQRIVDSYRAAFPKTALVFMTDDAEVLGYALAHGTGMRRDGIGSPWHEKTWIGSTKYAAVTSMAEAWQRAPVVFEWYGSYDYLKSRDWSFDNAVRFMLDQHVTLINDNIGAVPPEAMPKLLELGRRAGYRFVLREINHPSVTVPGHTMMLKMKWANTGVGKAYHPMTLQLALGGASGRIVHTVVATEAHPIDWLPGEHEITASLPVPPTLKPGDYSLAVGIDDCAKRPRKIQLAMDAPAADGWYVVSSVKVQ